MSIQAVAWVLTQDIKPAIAKLAMIAIANYADEHGKCWPSNAKLAKDCSYDKNELRKVLHRLQADGWIVIQERYQDSAQLTNVLVVNLPRGESAGHPRESAGHPRGGGGIPAGGEGVFPQGGEGVFPQGGESAGHPQNHHIEPSIEPSVDVSARKRAKTPSLDTRLPADWTLPPEWEAWALESFSSDGAAVAAEADRFRDYWLAAPGARGRKRDWAATWRNWCRNAKPNSNGWAKKPEQGSSKVWLDLLRESGALQ